MAKLQKIVPCLWFDGNAEEAVRFYVSVFKDARIKQVTHHGELTSKASGRPKGSVLAISFEIEGQPFLALDGGPEFSFTPAISLMVSCETQAEVDHLWDRLSADPEAEACGWLKDRFGVSWQIVPAMLDRMISDEDPARTERVMQVVLGMKKPDMKALADAYRG